MSSQENGSDPTSFPQPDGAGTTEGVQPPPVIKAAEPVEDRRIEIDGVQWLIRAAGSGAAGTGALGLAPVIAVRFFREDAPEKAVREALAPRNYSMMYDSELIRLWKKAKRIDEGGESDRASVRAL